MSKVEDFLTEREEQEIIEAIRIAERNTSGEIRVHIETTSEKEITDRTLEVFHFLKMDNTRLQNGVLFYVSVDEKNFAIFGDKGINDVVTANFWDSTKDIVIACFKKGQFAKGLIEGILKAGEQLEKHFPWDNQDKNELADQISKG